MNMSFDVRKIMFDKMVFGPSLAFLKNISRTFLVYVLNYWSLHWNWPWISKCDKNESKLHTAQGKTYKTVTFAYLIVMANIYKILALFLCIVIVIIFTVFSIILAVVIDSKVKPDKNGRLSLIQFCSCSYVKPILETKLI